MCKCYVSWLGNSLCTLGFFSVGWQARRHLPKELYHILLKDALAWNAMRHLQFKIGYCLGALADVHRWSRTITCGKLQLKVRRSVCKWALSDDFRSPLVRNTRENSKCQIREFVSQFGFNFHRLDASTNQRSDISHCLDCPRYDST